MEHFVVLILTLVALALVLRVVADGFDRRRIQSYLNGRGADLLECRWRPFGPGWFGSQSERIYRVVYRDRDRQERHAHAKTSMFAGVYLTDVPEANAPLEAASGPASLAEENEVLERRIAELERRLGEDR